MTTSIQPSGFDEHCDREVREMMREWKARGLPRESQLMRAVALWKSGRLSVVTAGQVENVAKYVMATGGIVLKD